MSKVQVTREATTAKTGYESYKLSGVDWLDEIPSHWEAKRLRYVASVNDEALAETTDPLYQFKYIDIGSVQANEGITPSLEEYVFEDAPSRARRIVRSGDTVVSTVRTYLGAIAPIKSEHAGMIASTGFAVVRPRTVEPGYLSYALSESRFVEAVVSRSVGVSYPAVNPADLTDIAVPLPPLDEQRTIASYLDRETGRISTLVTRKLELIDRLRERRSALISRIVTCGLDHDVRLKPSGVEWLGDVPEEWEVRKFSREVAIAEGQVDPTVDPYASMILIAPNHIESGTGRLLAVETAEEQGAESGKYLAHAGEVVYSKIRPALAKAVLAPSVVLCSADAYPMKGRDRVSNRYLFWLVLSTGFTQWSVLEADRVAMPKINRETLAELRLPVPPLGEQLAIADYLDQATAEIDLVIAKVEEAIAQLREYRSALITAVVTGKIDVCKTA